ncbi:MAG: hypothetical protein ABW250_05940 [Pyrinomonadaceae bacterium]
MKPTASRIFAASLLFTAPADALTSAPAFAQDARADRAKQALIDKSNSYDTRLNALDCGRRETPSTELWMSPAGASPPPCSPTLDPTPAPSKGAVKRPTRRRSGRL